LQAYIVAFTKYFFYKIVLAAYVQIVTVVILDRIRRRTAMDTYAF